MDGVGMESAEPEDTPEQTDCFLDGVKTPPLPPMIRPAEKSLYNSAARIGYAAAAAGRPAAAAALGRPAAAAAAAAVQ